MKQKKKQVIKILVVIFSIFLLFTSYKVYAEYTVYITNYGSKYHRSGCQYLSSSKIAIDIDDAKARGYTACSRCHPDSYISTSNTTNSTSSSTYKITSNYTTNSKSTTSTLDTTANIENTVSNSSTFSTGEIAIFIIFGVPFAISLIIEIIECIIEVISSIISKFKKKKNTEIAKVGPSQPKRTDINKNTKFNASICPNCGGRLILRNGKYGWFYGCNNFPYCKYTESTKKHINKSKIELTQCEVCGKYTNELKKGVCPECYKEIMDRVKSKNK